jgi:hypothetical protein
MRNILKAPPAISIAGIALLSTTAMLSLAQPAVAAPPDRGAAAVGNAVQDMSIADLVQYRPVARRAVIGPRRVYARRYVGGRYVGRPVLRRAAVVAATTPVVTVQPASTTWATWGWPFWWNRSAMYSGYSGFGSYAGYGGYPAPGSYASAYASAAIPRAAIIAPGRVIRVGNWVRPREFWWQPGGAIAAGVAWTAWPAASASPWVGTAPDSNLCWYRTSPFLLGWNGFWDVCQQQI